jgi:hypothetical protein
MLSGPRAAGGGVSLRERVAVAGWDQGDLVAEPGEGGHAKTCHPGPQVDDDAVYLGLIQPGSAGCGDILVSRGPRLTLEITATASAAGPGPPSLADCAPSPGFYRYAVGAWI